MWYIQRQSKRNVSWLSLLSGLQYKLLICLISIKRYHFKPITDFSKYSVKACKSTGDQKAEVAVSFSLCMTMLGGWGRCWLTIIKSLVGKVPLFTIYFPSFKPSPSPSPPPPPPPLSFFGSRLISRAAKTENPVPRSFFAPKQHGNACYAGYRPRNSVKFATKLMKMNSLLYFLVKSLKLTWGTVHCPHSGSR